MRLICMDAYEYSCLAKSDDTCTVYVILHDNRYLLKDRDDTPLYPRLTWDEYPIARLTFEGGYCVGWKQVYGEHILAHRFPPFTGWSKGRFKWWLKEKERMELFIGSRNLKEKTLYEYRDLIIVDEEE